jgi:SNF2 family DNA or RNA helicase
VQDNWRAEVGRFYASLRVRMWSRDEAGQLDDPVPVETGRKSRQKKSVKAAPLSYDILIINYTQLRLHEEALVSRPWSVVILDEAQYIKNPSSHTTKVACALVADFRLALSGTPIENRLLDLWSIMNFAMPGVLGSRAAFGRIFNGKDDPLARRRLSARVRPFVLRRTKKEVASDLPDRIEEEIVCEMEGSQASLYRAEVKRARAMLLKVRTSAQLDKLRFHILTSLLRLRQMCCHPVLVGAGKPGDVSAKLLALMELLEPLMEEGHKVLVFSQFVEMLELIRTEVVAREWPHFLLTGQTEDRGAMVDSFQRAEGASIFLISLKAGGSGLNLTAASYVVLFDPWWNPAVENQAIDRTHRIGQVNKVIAYRLLVRDTIEEKIRQLQKQKSDLATDVLGEEGFAKALTIDDFRFLLGGGEDGAPG